MTHDQNHQTSTEKVFTLHITDGSFARMVLRSRGWSQLPSKTWVVTAVAILASVAMMNGVDAWVAVAARSSFRDASSHERRFVDKSSYTATAARPMNFQRHSLLPLSAAAASSKGGGFGGGAGAAAAGKEVKLKPKQQWDRYTALKKESAVKVAVRVVNNSASGDGGGAESAPTNDWLEVGSVKSESTIGAEVAVARQRALIAEHAKRLFPLLVSAKATIEWGYSVAAARDDGATEQAVWTAVDKSVLDQAPSGIEKLIGFEGTPDPATGFYCVYNEGRLVKSTDGDIGLKPSSKKLG